MLSFIVVFGLSKALTNYLAGRLADHIGGSFSHELTDEEHLPYTLAIHSGRDANGNEHSPHAHLMISEPPERRNRARPERMVPPTTPFSLSAAAAGSVTVGDGLRQDVPRQQNVLDHL